MNKKMFFEVQLSYRIDILYREILIEFVKLFRKVSQVQTPV